MKYTRITPVLLASLLSFGGSLVSPGAFAATQWKWRDASGAIQYSDRPPPAGTPEASILARPQAARVAPPPAASSASEGDASASTPKAPVKAGDPELEAKRRKAEEEKEAKRKADEEKQAKIRADNCQQARNYERTLKDGIRIARTNSKGEREVLDDKGRADELKRAQEAIASNCK